MTVPTQPTPADPEDYLPDPYPEHAKLVALDGKNQTVGQFIEWLSEKGYAICEHVSEDIETVYSLGDHSECIDGAWLPLQRSVSSWIAEYFEINPVKIEAEKRMMLDAMRDGK